MIKALRDGRSLYLEQFALASVYPRSIAWLIRPDEWERFEEIVKYNCAMVGGYFNVFIPLTPEDTLSENYQHFLIDYDPDLIVLAPRMQPESLETLHSHHLHPFAVIPWRSVSQVAILDPWSGGAGINATVGADITFNPLRSLVAVANDKFPDASRLALVACGDVEPREPMWHVMDEVISLNATGHREMFLMRLLKPEFIESRLVEAHVNEEGNIHPAPNRYQLSNLIEEENQFPLVDAIERQECCCRLQHHVATSQSFAGLTAFYNRSGTPRRIQRGSDTPGVVVLVSNNFGLEQAILFWNLRASGFIVSWLSFAEVESNTDALIKWLESDYGGGFYSLVSGGLDIAFASQDGNLAHLEVIFGDLLGKRQKGWPDWRIVPYEDIVFYNYIRPNIKQERVSVIESAGQYAFIPKLPLPDRLGVYTVVLEWNGLMFPQSDTVISNLVSSEIIKGFLPHFRKGHP